MNGNEMAAVTNRKLRPYFLWKCAIDRVLAAVLLLPALQLIGALIALIRISSSGPAIYRQKRVGKDGRVFTMYKLRSMRIDAETVTGPVWSAAGSDSRVTPLGYWLRKLHLDELPQLMNVIKGEMSLIGPRPERPEFVRVLNESIPDYATRLVIAPGITGLAQINLPPDTDLNSVRKKLVLDLEYVETAGFFLDLRMFVCTLARLFGIKGEIAMRLMRLKRMVQLAETMENRLEPVANNDLTPDVIASTGEKTADVELTEISSPRSMPRRKPDSPEDPGILATVSSN